MKCYQCQKELSPNDRYCSGCGADQKITKELIRQASAGSQDAITELYNRTYNAVYHTAHSLIKDEDTVLDIVQDSYIKGFQSLDTLENPENYQAWMKRIAINKAKDWLKKKKPVLFSELESDDDTQSFDFRDERLEHLPEEIIDRQETTRLINEILNNLSEDQRMVIGMYYYEQMSVREIAQILSISENTVKSRLNYGRKKIETQVRELEKRGTKLYSLTPVPFLLFLFKSMDVQAAEIPPTNILKNITTEISTGTASQTAFETAKTIGKASGNAFSGVAGKGIAVKIIAGIVAVSIAGAGITGVVIHSKNKSAASPSEKVESIKKAEKEERADIPEKSKTEETKESAITAHLFEGYYTSPDTSVAITITPIDDTTANIIMDNIAVNGANAFNAEGTAVMTDNKLVLDLQTSEQDMAYFSLSDGSLNVEISEHYQAKANTYISGVYSITPQEEMTPADGNASGDELDGFFGTYKSETGNVDLKLYMENNVLKADIGDDVVVGHTTIEFIRWSLEPGYWLICDSETEHITLQLQADGSLVWNTLDDVPTFDGRYIRGDE